MSLIDTLTMNAEAAAEAKGALVRALHATAEAAEFYAHCALDAVTHCYDAAEVGAPVASTYTAYADIHKCVAGAQRMLESCAEIATIIAAVNESTDDEANEAYAQHLIEMTRTSRTSAILEGVARRIQIVNSALPQNPAPAARYNTAVFGKSEK